MRMGKLIEGLNKTSGQISGAIANLTVTPLYLTRSSPQPPQLEICVVIIPSSSSFADYSEQHCSYDRIPVCFWSVGFSKVCDANGHWYLADSGSYPGVVLLVTGRSLSHDTSGLRPAASYRAASDFSSSAIIAGRTSVAFKLMPQGNAILDCSPISAAGHVIPQSYVPISISQFMDDLSAPF